MPFLWARIQLSSLCDSFPFSCSVSQVASDQGQFSVFIFRDLDTLEELGLVVLSEALQPGAACSVLVIRWDLPFLSRNTS